jgi:valyl-tRNA synthetase
VLKTISKFLAPFGPFYAESLYQNLKTTKDKESVHLESWPQLLPASDSIESEMKEARAAVTLALEARSKENIKVRQPLRSLVIKRHIPEEYRAIIADEVNVKEVLIDPNLEGEIKLDLLVTEDLREEGTLRELMRAIQDKRKFWNCLPTQMIKVVLGVEEPLKAILQKQGYKELLQSSVSARELIITDTTIAFQPFEGHRISIEIIQ